MGVKFSNVAAGVKQQANIEGKKLYQLVDLKGGGELVELMKVVKDHSEIDKRIRKEVLPFLYNKGHGMKVNVKELIEMRNKETNRRIIKPTKKQRAEGSAQINKQTGGDECECQVNQDLEEYRFVCWDLKERGSVGETILHLCLLNSSSKHADLAKRLLHVFPNLINDIYVSEEYYGENVLHMAIVNEDPAMVKFLLDKNVDYHQRCCGNFFCPDDQKDSRTDTYEHEWVAVCDETNYEGYTYWGEYPLPFAACCGQEECVRILNAKGADPNHQDVNGNMTLHMLVIHNKQKMFQLVYNLGGKLNIRNKQGLTPLTLAAKLARKEMYEYILEIEREVYWMYGNVMCAGYPLQEIDTISTNGAINKNSALNLIVYGEEEGHLFMMDGLIVNLLQEKWRTFARFRFYRRFLFFLVYFIFFVAAFLLRPGSDPLAKKQRSTFTNSTADPCYLLRVYDRTDYVRLILEVVVVIGSCIYLLLAMKEVKHQGFKIFFTTLSAAPAKTLFLLSCILVTLMVPGRAMCKYAYEDVIGVCAMLSTAPYFLFFCRGFRIVGPFVVMIYKMIKGDLLRFFLIYAVFVIGFSQAMYLNFRGKYDIVFSRFLDDIMGMFAMAVGEIQDFYDIFSEARIPALAKTVFVLYMVMVSLLLINMLIAMMGNTYQLIANTQKEWFRQWAKIVLVMEQTVTSAERERQQKKYSQPMVDGRRALVIRFHLMKEEE